MTISEAYKLSIVFRHLADQWRESRPTLAGQLRAEAEALGAAAQASEPLPDYGRCRDCGAGLRWDEWRLCWECAKEVE